MSATIRGATPNDGTAVFPIWEALRRHNSRTDPRIVPTPVGETEFVVGFVESLKRPESCVFVAELDGRVVGFVRGGIEENLPDRLPERHAAVGYLYVDPSARRIGIGRQLFEAVAGWASAQPGISHVEMSVLAADGGAREFWTQLGFSPFIHRLWTPLNRDADE